MTTPKQYPTIYIQPKHLCHANTKLKPIQFLSENQSYDWFSDERNCYAVQATGKEEEQRQ